MSKSGDRRRRYIEVKSWNFTGVSSSSSDPTWKVTVRGLDSGDAACLSSQLEAVAASRRNPEDACVQVTVPDREGDHATVVNLLARERGYELVGGPSYVVAGKKGRGITTVNMVKYYDSEDGEKGT